MLSDSAQSEPALSVLATLDVKGRAPKTGYSRSKFGDGWAIVNDCDIRNRMLARAMPDERLAQDGCRVQSGTLLDPYTGREIAFQRGPTTSDDVQIDHVVALSDAWQKGAQNLDDVTRIAFANDPLNLQPVAGSVNMQKGDADAASWLPENKDYRCPYVARQIAVKRKYRLWVTEAEKLSMEQVLQPCAAQVVPAD